MNSIPAKATVNTLRLSTARAYRLGIKDARGGRLCVPEMYFAQRAQQVAYARGHAAVAGETVGSRYFLGGAK